MSCSAHAEPSSRTKKPGEMYEAQTHVCTGWLPLPFAVRSVYSGT